MAKHGDATGHHPLQAEYERFLPPDLASALVRQYSRLKERVWADDHEGVQESGGKVAEHALRATQHLAGITVVGLREEIRDMPGQLRVLEQIPRGDVDDALRVVIPRAVGALYTFRNKRSGGHTASEVDPSRADAALTERMADWLMAEFFRLGSKLPLDEAEAAISALIERRLPVVYTAGNYRRVLKADLPLRAEIMVLLYSEATGGTIAELQRWTAAARTSVARQVDALERDRLVRTQRAGNSRRVFLLPTGERLVEREGWLQPTQT